MNQEQMKTPLDSKRVFRHPQIIYCYNILCLTPVLLAVQKSELTSKPNGVGTPKKIGFFSFKGFGKLKLNGQEIYIYKTYIKSEKSKTKRLDQQAQFEVFEANNLVEMINNKRKAVEEWSEIWYTEKALGF